MEFNLSEETRLLKESARRFLRKECTSFPVREQLKTDDGFSPDIWMGMADLGWPGLIFEEKYGGFEGDFFDLFILMEEIGRAMLPGPFFTSVILSGLIIKESGNQELNTRVLPSIISGE